MPRKIAPPVPVKTRSGCKVSWNYYKTEAEAKRASNIAMAEAVERERDGYDFGYQAPGSVQLIGNDWPEYAGLWQVCFP